MANRRQSGLEWEVERGLEEAEEVGLAHETESEVETAPSAKPVRARVLSEAAEQSIRTLDKFASRQARLKLFHIPAINDVANEIVVSWRTATPIRTIYLVSHTDNTGRRPYDLRLANGRALGVQKALIAAIDRLRPGESKKIRFVRQNVGSAQPYTCNDTPHGRALNRRVQIFSSPTRTGRIESGTLAAEQEISSGTGERFIDGAMNGNNGTEAYFFLADHYVTYSWTNDRALDGARPVSDWGLPPSIVGPGTSSGPDAALNGKRAYIDKAYFFRGPNYARVRLAGRVLETPSPPSINPAWRFPAKFASDIDAAFNGRFSREGKAFFFKGDQYLRYRWGDPSGRGDGVDPGYPVAMKRLKGMPADFASGVHAALDGDGAWARYGYLFKQDQYIRMDWNPRGEPFIDGPAANIQKKWPGLVELLLAGKAKSQALEWIERARLELLGYTLFLSGTAPYANQALMEAALLAHFHIEVSMLPATKALLTAQIVTTYVNIVNTLNNSSTIFRYRTDAEVVADRGQPDIPLAYATFSGTMNFSGRFPTNGPLSRAARVLHESVHVIDNGSGTASTHIPEWYVTDAEATKLGLPIQANNPKYARRYDEMPTSDKLHNPSSFAAFAQHIRYGSDTRYGAGKPSF